MDFDRPHHRTTPTTTTAAANTSEIFICLASRLSSSSTMKLSKSILSPGRAGRDAPASLSTSLSRKLRTNGSLKGGASPFFTTPGKKRGCAFENPEPSSPKVTCIGQVRVKTKKKVKQTRSLSSRRSGEISFRKLEQNEDRICSQPQRYSNQDCLRQRNQRWVHLPVTICEALRSFGAEFSCLLPCKSPCFSSDQREKEEKQNGSNGGDDGQSSCGAVFTRWLVSVNEGEGGKRREIELVVGGGDEEEERRTDLREGMSMRSSRRHVLEDFEVKDDKIQVKGQSLEEEEETGRVSICIPPKNALLLMRCRSDPMKMAALTGRCSWDADANAASKHEDIYEDEESVGKEIEEQLEVQDCEVADEALDEIPPLEIPAEAEAEAETEVPQNAEEDVQNMHELLNEAQQMQEEFEQEPEVVEDYKLIEGGEEEEEEEVESNMSSFEALLDQESSEHDEEDTTVQRDEVEEQNPHCSSSSSTESDEEEVEDGGSPQESAQYEQEAALKKVDESPEETDYKPQEEDEEQEEEETEVEKKEEKNEEWSGKTVGASKEEETRALPECLLLMMCEPKLSMEVSKETWVCKTDFVQWLPERPPKPPNQNPTRKGCEHQSIKDNNLIADSNKPKPISLPPANNQKHLQQPPRSSCSLPAAAAAASMASMIEQKLVNAVGYEPFVLTRCKSEPMRTAAAKLMPESCFWKNAMRKLEPHRRATIGVCAAGVGF